MANDRITLTIHGLEAHKDRVRAYVFLTKTRALLDALRAADREINERACFDYLISDLQIGSAQAEIREVQKSRKRPPRGSSVRLVKETARRVYDGDVRADTNRRMIKSIQSLGVGVRKTFSFAELTTGPNDKDAVRIDDFFETQTIVAAQSVNGEAEIERSYRGRSIGSFDGILKEIDLRGVIARAKLILTAGGLELDCVCNELTVENLRENLDRRVYIEGFAHYDGFGLLPTRVDIKSIQTAKANPSLLEWRGRFDISDPEYLGEDVF